LNMPALVSLSLILMSESMLLILVDVWSASFDIFNSRGFCVARRPLAGRVGTQNRPAGLDAAEGWGDAWHVSTHRK
jgi:hypothetical protein